ncbi:MAG: HlyD family type I secretion periplasmic adaptor subunit [Parasphingopyxis sp.]|uniref:HlyD family type I secretion periplasmic adaptor subunit n=1 Tax=Parasphingopyxis sp. TaxID=1920299 RepID=UPI003FA00534
MTAPSQQEPEKRSTGGWLASRFPSLARHWTILKTSWALENERQTQRKQIENTEFLPAALEVIETPPSPVGRKLIWFLASMVVVALLWAFIGRMDIVAVAPGQTIPVGRVQTIQASELGVVRAIHVVEGQHVEAGELLVELDPTASEATVEQTESALATARLDAARARAIIAGLRGEDAAFVPPDGADPAVVTVQRSLTIAALAEYRAQRRALENRIANAEAERAAAREAELRNEETLPMIERRATALRELADRGFASELRTIELEEQVVERRRNRNAARNSVLAANATISVLNQELMQLRQGFLRATLAELADAESRIAQAEGELVKSRQRTSLQRILAPESGTIQQLQVNTLGGVVEPAAPLMTLVPDAGGLIVEASVLNRDIGFVHEGQEVAVKFDAFPFTDYGTVPGEVISISRDAVNHDILGLVYMARIRLAQASIEAGGRTVPITPGMSAQAEIKTGERRIIDYLLSPIARAVDEAGRER